MTTTYEKAGLSDTSPVKTSDDGPYIPVENPGFRLTPWKASDQDDCIALYNHPDVGKWSCFRPFPYTVEHFDFYLDHIPQLLSTAKSLASASTAPPLETIASFPFMPLSALRDLSNGRVAGSISVIPSAREKDAWEMAYDLRPEYQGRGLGKEMIFAALKFMRWMGVKRVIAFCEKANLPSAGVLKRTGFAQYTDHLQAWPEEKGGGERSVSGYEIYL